MRKIIKIFCVLLLLSSCYKKSNFNFLKFETKIDNDTIKSIEFNRGIVQLDNYYLMDNCQFIYKDTFPNWIKDFSKPDFSFVDYKFIPSINDIEAPYVIFKHENDSILYLVKYKDTLKFRIIEF